MERPVYLNKKAYTAILVSLSERAGQYNDAAKAAGYDGVNDCTDADVIEHIMATPSRHLYYYCNLMDRVELLTGLFIEFNDDELDAGLTYLIDAESAEEIAAGDATIMLRSGEDSVLVPRARLERAFSSGCVIDYRE